MVSEVNGGGSRGSERGLLSRSGDRGGDQDGHDESDSLDLRSTIDSLGSPRP